MPGDGLAASWVRPIGRAECHWLPNSSVARSSGSGGLSGRRVAGRTGGVDRLSGVRPFSFKGKAVDVTTIARVLNVSHVLEGSVRKSGAMVRITVQLIRTSDSSHVWSATYDRATDTAQPRLKQGMRCMAYSRSGESSNAPTDDRPPPSGCATINALALAVRPPECSGAFLWAPVDPQPADALAMQRR